MSRTDVHRPGWVQERDPHCRREFRIQHVHFVRDCWDEDAKRWLARRSALCDLHLFEAGKGWVQTRCRPQYVGGRNPYCGCRMCTGHHWRRQQRRRDRHQARRAVRRGDYS